MEFLSAINPAYIPFLFIISLMAAIMYRAHISSDQNFNLYDMLTESSTGKASIEKVGMLMAMLSISWWFFDLVASGKATWEDAVAYGGLLGLAKVVNTFIKAKTGKEVSE